MVLTNAEQVFVAHPIAPMGLMQGMRSTESGLSSINDEVIWRMDAGCGLNAPVDEVVIEDGHVTGV